MYTFRHEDADFAKLFTCNRPYAVAYMKGVGTYAQAGGRILFFPAGDRGILVVVNLRGLPVCSQGTSILADLALSEQKESINFPAFVLAPTKQGKVWCANLLGAFGIAKLPGQELVLTRRETLTLKTEIIARGTIQKAFGQI